MPVTSLPPMHPHLRLGSVGPVLVSCFDNWPNGEMLACVAKAQLELSRSHGRVLSLGVVPLNPRGGATPEQPAAERAEALKQSASVSEQLKHVTAGSALVIHSRGIIAVMVRSFLVAMSLVSTSSTPFKALRTLDEAIEWFGTLKDAPPVPPGLAADVQAWIDAP